MKINRSTAVSLSDLDPFRVSSRDIVSIAGSPHSHDFTELDIKEIEIIPIIDFAGKAEKLAKIYKTEVEKSLQSAKENGYVFLDLAFFLALKNTAYEEIPTSLTKLLDSDSPDQCSVRLDGTIFVDSQNNAYILNINATRGIFDYGFAPRIPTPKSLSYYVENPDDDVCAKEVTLAIKPS